MYMDHRMKHVREMFERLCPGDRFLPQVRIWYDLNKNQTHSSKEANKEDEMAQELSLFDELTE